LKQNIISFFCITRSRRRCSIRRSQIKHINDYRRKKVLVVGMSRSGIAAVKLLFELGALVTVND
jgi:cation diffusion facilitator CzcD-associated flavoprotein CzcO